MSQGFQASSFFWADAPGLEAVSFKQNFAAELRYWCVGGTHVMFFRLAELVAAVLALLQGRGQEKDHDNLTLTELMGFIAEADEDVIVDLAATVTMFYVWIKAGSLAFCLAGWLVVEKSAGSQLHYVVHKPVFFFKCRWRSTI